MILIDDKLISNDVIERQFICQLDACKGACCVQGEAGAPLEMEELDFLEAVYEQVESLLTPEGKKTIDEQGLYVIDNFSGNYATPLVDGTKACAYVCYDKNGIAKCSIQEAYNTGLIDWIKPISCHLYPIRVTHDAGFDMLNYDKWDICKAACSFGKSEQVALYEFLKEPLIRKYGEEFYEKLDDIAQDFLAK